MAYKNLRIVYNNLADSANISANTTSGTYTINNLKSDTKGLVHRSTANTVTYTLTWSSEQTIDSVILPYTNLTKNATVSISFFANDTDTNPLYTYSGSVKEYDLSNALTDITVSQAMKYSYGGGRCVSIWSDTWEASSYSVKKLVITLADTNNSDGFIEVSRLVCGKYWSPTYNTKFGIQVGYEDSSEQERTDAGNLITNNKAIHKKLTLDLEWLTPSDKNSFLDLVRTIGTRKSLFISVFPEDVDFIRENLYELYGRFETSPMLTYQMFTVYTTSLQICEV